MRYIFCVKKLATLALYGFLFFGASISYAGSCEKMEYAEMPTENLLNRVCMYERFFELEKRTALKMGDIGALKEMRSHADAHRGCYDELGRMYQVLVSREIKIPDQCKLSESY